MNPDFSIPNEDYTRYGNPNVYRQIGDYDQYTSAPYMQKPLSGLLQSFQKAGEDLAAAREKQRKDSQEQFKTMVELGDYEGAKKNFITGYLGDNAQMTPEQEQQFRQNFELTRREAVAKKLQAETDLGKSFAAAPVQTQVQMWPQVYPNIPLPQKKELDAQGVPTTLSFEEAQKLLTGKGPQELQALQAQGVISAIPQMGQSITVRLSQKPDVDAISKMTETTKTAPRIKPGEIQAIAKPAATAVDKFDSNVAKSYYSPGKELQAAQEAKAELVAAAQAIQTLSMNPYRSQEDVQNAAEDLRDAQVKFSQAVGAIPLSERYNQTTQRTRQLMSTTIGKVIEGLQADPRGAQFVGRLIGIQAAVNSGQMTPEQATAAVNEVVTNVQRSGIPFNAQRVAQVASQNERARHNAAMERIGSQRVQIALGQLNNALQSTGIRARLADNLITFRNGSLQVAQGKLQNADKALTELLKQRAIQNGISLEKLNLLERSLKGQDDGRVLRAYAISINAQLRDRAQKMARDLAVNPTPRDPLALDYAEQLANSTANREAALQETFLNEIVGDGALDDSSFNRMIDSMIQMYAKPAATSASTSTQPNAADRASARAQEYAGQALPAPPTVPGARTSPPLPPTVPGETAAESAPAVPRRQGQGQRQRPGQGQGQGQTSGPLYKVRKSAFVGQ